MQTHQTRLAAFRASRPYRLAVGRRATVTGDPRPYAITEWHGSSYELSCLEGDKLSLSRHPVSAVTILPGTPCREGVTS